MRKNAQMGSLIGVIIALVVVGLILGIGFLIFSEMQETTSDDVQYTILGEQLGSLDAGFVYPAHNSTTSTDCRGNTYAVISIVNRSDGLVVNTLNYSVDATSGKITNLSSDMTPSPWDVNYTYYAGDDACQGFKDASTSMKNVNTYLPIIVIIVIVGILLAIVFGVLPSMGGRGGGGGSVAEI